ncbi:MAG: ABC transporter ATP-binding protein/permease [Alphaproteobacteria bacterium]|nr:ABC transporter ATP-binding protein/permease [Alphaproteobacteria bacterium]
MKGLAPFLKDAWRLAWPYFASEEKWVARGLLLLIIGLNLTTVFLTVVLNYWNREFYNALQEHDYRAFIDLLFFYRRTESGLLPGFCPVAVVFILVYVYRTYLNQWLQIRWRRWLTGRFADEWLADRAYYHINLTTDHAAIGTDNPDQRIAEDLRDFVGDTLALSVGLLSNIVSLGSFVGILWGLSGSVTLLGHNIPGYMVWVAIAYAGLGTWLTHLVGRPLVGLNFRQQRYEADFRYALVRLRENAEGVALYRGEQEEKEHLQSRFGNVIGNWWAIMRRTKLLNTLTSGYDQIAVVFPIIVAAPRYFSGQIQLGGLTQTAGAFGRVQDSLSWFVAAYASLAAWRATVERLTTFHNAIVEARAAYAEGLTSSDGGSDRVEAHDLTLELPNRARLLEHNDLTFTPGRSVVVSGPSGSGKSTLFRALAGIWPFGSGQVQRPARSLFLPQRTYIPLGTLRHVVTYPAESQAYTDDEIAQAMRDTGLGTFIDRLDEDTKWAQQLSGGEQQRVAWARALLAKPDWLFLDEATANLDPESEERLYRTLKERLPGTTVVSIAHRPSVAAFHDEHLVFRREEGQPGKLVPAKAEAIAAGA